MNARELTDRAEAISENAFLKLIGRTGMAFSLPLMVAATTWLGNAVWDMKAEQARQTGEISVLRTTIEFNMADRYRGSDAARDFKLRDQKDVELERRINANEGRIDRLEGKVNAQPRQP